MVTTLWKKPHYAKCFGFWVLSCDECLRCAVASNCEMRTKEKTTEVENPPELDTGEIIEHKVVTPLEYMLKSLGGKFDQVSEEKGKAIIHKFKNDGKTVIAVAIGEQGKIKIVSISKNISKIFGCLESYEEVESVLAEML